MENKDNQSGLEEETYYAIKEAIQAMKHYDNGEDFALITSLRRLRDIEQILIEKLNITK
jgi:hypothetical protein